MTMRANHIEILDVMKFVSACLVVAIHALPLRDIGGGFWLTTLARLAVPLFFTISAYLLFKRIFDAEQTKREQNLIVIRFCKRIAVLLLIWIVISFPILWESCYSARESMAHFCLRLVFSPGNALWFLSALLFGTMIQFFAFRLFGLAGMLFLGVAAHCVCVGTDAYYAVIPLAAQTAATNYSLFFGGPISCTTPSSLMFIALGAFFAKKNGSKYVAWSQKHKITAAFVFCAMLAGLFLEARLTVIEFHLVKNLIVYFMLLPCIAVLFPLMLSLRDIHFGNYAQKLGKISIFIYVLHPILISLSERLNVTSGNSLSDYVIVLIFCIMTANVLLCCEKKFSFLRWLH